MSAPITILLVDDEEATRAFLRRALEPAAARIVEAANGAEALKAWESASPDLVITDLNMPELDGLGLAGRILEKSPLTPILMVTGRGDAASAVEAMKRGVTDYLTKPVDVAALLERVEGVIQARVLPRRAAFGARFLEADDRRTLVTVSPRMRPVLETLALVARGRSNVFIHGETGAGKEVVARAIHAGGGAAGRPFVAVNCAGIPEGVLESQLFGHVKGAFTGATADARGVFVAASGGTLFLDEIAEMPIHLQVKLLRAVQEREVLPVGGTAPVRVDVRLVSATNRPPEQALREGRLREDLFYRLAVIPILIPPLRERPEDIPVLAAYFGARLAEAEGGGEKTLSPAALAKFLAHSWPGNVRELQNLMERLYATCPDGVIDVRHLAGTALANAAAAPSAGAIPAWDEVEKTLLRQALEAAGGNKSEAARLLRIDRKRLLRKVRKHGLDTPQTPTP